MRLTNTRNTTQRSFKRRAVISESLEKGWRNGLILLVEMEKSIIHVIAIDSDKHRWTFFNQECNIGLFFIATPSFSAALCTCQHYPIISIQKLQLDLFPIMALFQSLIINWKENKTCCLSRNEISRFVFTSSLFVRWKSMGKTSLDTKDGHTSFFHQEKLSRDSRWILSSAIRPVWGVRFSLHLFWFPYSSDYHNGCTLWHRWGGGRPPPPFFLHFFFQFIQGEGVSAITSRPPPPLEQQLLPWTPTTRVAFVSTYHSSRPLTVSWGGRHFSLLFLRENKMVIDWLRITWNPAWNVKMWLPISEFLIAFPV